VHSVITHESPNVAFAAMIVWIEMLPEDRDADIEALIREMADPRIRWFHDPRQHVGRAIATSLGAMGKIAWDVYLFFDMAAEWKNELLRPQQWVHQLSDSWADPTHLRYGDQLEPELRRLLRDLLGSQMAA
jgi:hypothetical protein